jgi:hypothetical protein
MQNLESWKASLQTFKIRKLSFLISKIPKERTMEIKIDSILAGFASVGKGNSAAVTFLIYY